MGLAYSDVTLRNPRFPDLKPIHAPALADSGSVHLCIPQNIALELNLETIDRREIALADGHSQSVAYVGPIQMCFKNRTGFFGAIVFGNEVLVGTIPMDVMDLVVIPKTRTVDVNPESPDIACSIAK